MLDHPFMPDHHRIEGLILSELVALQSGLIEPQVAPGKTGVHTIECGDDLIVKLGMTRSQEDKVEIHLIELIERLIS